MSKSTTIARSEAEREEVHRFRCQTLEDEFGWFMDSADHERRPLRDAHDRSACLVVLRVADGGIAGTMRIDLGADASAMFAPLRTVPSWRAISRSRAANADGSERNGE